MEDNNTKIQSRRHQHVAEEMGHDNEEEKEEEQKAMAEESQRKAEKKADKERIEGNFTYKSVSYTSKIMDKYYIDPILGVVCPELGDGITQAFALTAINMSMFTIKSVPLTLAVIYNVLIDLVSGAIPILGDIFDAHHKSFEKNRHLIVGFVEDDHEIINEVNKGAIKAVIGIIICCIIIYLCISMAISFFHWISSKLFGYCIARRSGKLLGLISIAGSKLIAMI